MKIILIGIQGAGKSTQGNKISAKYKIPYLSSGHIFRQMAKEKTSFGRYIKEMVNAGALISDDKTLEIVEEYLSRPEYSKGYILDGFPRTVEQAKKFKNGIDKVIYLKVSDKEALWRLSGRVDDGVREDNTLQALRQRIDLFHQKTKPVITHFKRRGSLVEIDGEQPVKTVFKEIDQVLEAIKNIRK